MCRPTPLASAAIVLALGACATYPERTAAAFRDFEGGDLTQARKAFADADTTGSAFLSGAEAGMIALAEGDWQAAQDQLHKAAAEVEELEQRALVSASGLGESMVSWAVNEQSRAYAGEGFERVLLHSCLGLTYLAQGLVDDLWVETRLANRLLESEEELYEKKYAAGGLGHFVSAVAYELIGRYDEAYIDYKRMHEKGVGTELAGRALVRLAHDLGYTDELERWTEKYGPVEQIPGDSAQVVIIAGIGLGPFKRENTLTIPTPDGVLQWSVPSYIHRPQAVGGLKLLVEGGSVAVRTSVIEDVGRVSAENLDDRIAWLATKSAVRGVLKRELTQKLEHDHEVLGRIVGDVFSFLTERADLRSWSTLPDSWQAARVFVPSGANILSLEALGGETRALGGFQLEPGETLFILARTVGGRLYAHVVGGQPLGAPAPDPIP
jgi:hypothetical protein